jgi:hypothetical protein
MKECCICLESLAKYCVSSSSCQKNSFRQHLRQVSHFGIIDVLGMVNIKGFPLLGVYGVSKLSILVVPIERSMPDHDHNISIVQEHTLQAIYHR